MDEILNHQYFKQGLTTVITIVVFIALSLIIKKLTKGYARRTHLSEHRANLITKYIGFVTLLLFVVIIIAIWGISPGNLFGFIASVLTVIGVAFFAQWSMLSNITAGMILFFTYPFRIGDVIKIHDKDYPLEARIEDIKTFHTLLRTEDGELITYPNSLLLQKGVSIVPQKQEDKEFYD